MDPECTFDQGLRELVSRYCKVQSEYLALVRTHKETLVGGLETPESRESRRRIMELMASLHESLVGMQAKEAEKPGSIAWWPSVVR